ncbi:LLM class flavin-dependent oxidoreductase [Nonomuraea sp. B10E15]|uniref:LLM class flavin-dependent oxidoreductase n=1 Tax=Nonomuraea sp. B10E15 TaxID=3153560 RepID=UPI00325E2426
MRFAFMPVLSDEPSSWPRLLAMFQAADEMEFFESGWLFDHSSSAAVNTSGPCYETWTVMTALAHATSRLRLGTMVLAVARRHPALLAQMALTLDTISEGRLELGIGAGWRELDHLPQGIPFGTPASRADRLDEGCEALVRLLSGHTVSAHGGFFTLAEARCDIPPVQRPHPPLCIGGGGERRTLPTAARWAQHWNHPGGRAEDFSRKRLLLLRCCAQLGRDPSEIITSATIHGEDSAPESMVKEVAQLGEAGADLVILRIRPPHEAARLERLATVLEPLR